MTSNDSGVVKRQSGGSRKIFRRWDVGTSPCHSAARRPSNVLERSSRVSRLFSSTSRGRLALRGSRRSRLSFEPGRLPSESRMVPKLSPRPFSESRREGPEGTKAQWFFSAQGGTRTRTAVTGRGILSPLCLPIPPPGRVVRTPPTAPHPLHAAGGTRRHLAEVPSGFC